MLLFIALAIIATAAGALATYLYDEGASVATRLCTGACIGLAAFGLVGFILALLLGLTPISIAASTLIVALPLLILLDQQQRERVTGDLNSTLRSIRRWLQKPSGTSIVYFLYYAVVVIGMWLVFDRAMLDRTDGIYTGVLNNFGDLPFHLSAVTGFAFGNNYPPEDPTFAGVRFTYPFLTDFVSAVFVRCGASLRDSLFIENILLAIAFVGVLHRWGWEMLRDRVGALLTPLLVLLNGGFGFVLLFTAAFKNDNGLFGALRHLAPSFTVIPVESGSLHPGLFDTNWRWGNAISSLLVTQRGILLGLPLAVIVFTQWWMATGDGDAEKQGRGDGDKKGKSEKEKGKINSLGDAEIDGRGAEEKRASLFPFSFFLLPSVRRMIAAGIVAGLLPLVHAHSFVVVMAMAGCLALLQWRWREWITFAVVASIIALPQMWWSTSSSAVKASNFFGLEFGWDHGSDNPAWFWFKNTGLFIPLIFAAILWRGKGWYLVSRRLLIFYLPFTLCFIVPNVVRLAPWIWDNVKVLFYWWLASAPVVALLLARLWRDGPVRRALAVVLLVCLTAAGALDVLSIVTKSGEYQIFDPNGVKFAELIKQQTKPRSLVIHAPVHNTPVFLTGRRSLMGYPGHIWTHGLDFSNRESEIKRIYAGGPDAESLLYKNGVDYAVVGPLERMVMPVNELFWSRFTKVGQVGDYRLYKIAQP